VAWPIAAVARMSKVTSRTLRHYDEIGLLKPAFVASNNYRYYEQEELLRLQQILLLRELDLGLGAIAEVLDGQRDRVEALRLHVERLRAERRRLDRLARTVSRTIAQIEGGDAMSAEEMFEGFAERRAEMEQTLVERHGEGVREHFRTAKERTAGWTKEDYLAAQREGDRINERLAELMRAGAAPDEARVLDVVDEHYAAITRFWTPDRASYTSLGELYAENPEFRETIETVAPGFVEYLRQAMTAYAQQRLS